MNPPEATGDRLLRVRDVARRTGCCRRTVYQWIRTGQIEAYRVPSGHYRVPSSAVVSVFRTARVDRRDK